MTAPVDISGLLGRLESADPQTIVAEALQLYGTDCAIAFSGSDDVVLVEMAAQSGLPFSVVTVDTGRLHPETYELIDLVRLRYQLQIRVTSPDAAAVQAMVRAKGLFSFYQDGHHECCQIRKVEPLANELVTLSAWVTGQRRDSSDHRRTIPSVEIDDIFVGREGPLVKFNPLAGWSRKQLWDYIAENSLPYNALHDRGFSSIGCAPCTRSIEPGAPERSGRWWWEENESRECGLHARVAAERSE